ncbi:hypothetical protein STANM309S_04960 [Streptomyces tanashiensis]
MANKALATPHTAPSTSPPSGMPQAGRLGHLQPRRSRGDAGRCDRRRSRAGDVRRRQVEVELRPQRRLRVWQLAPIVGLGALGSLMFAFPLAFDFGDSGAVIAMLGLLICSCAAGWGMMAARKVGYTWPGLSARGSDRTSDWRVVAAYAVMVAAVVALAVWRVARLR